MSIWEQKPQAKWLLDFEEHLPAVHSKELEQEVELLHPDADFQRRTCHQTKGKVTFNFRFYYITSSLTDFFVEEIQLPPINHGVGIEPRFESM